MLTADIRRQRISRMRGRRHWRWHLDEMYVKISGEMLADKNDVAFFAVLSGEEQKELRALHVIDKHGLSAMPVD